MDRQSSREARRLSRCRHKCLQSLAVTVLTCCSHKKLSIPGTSNPSHVSSRFYLRICFTDPSLCSLPFLVSPRPRDVVSLVSLLCAYVLSGARHPTFLILSQLPCGPCSTRHFTQLWELSGTCKPIGVAEHLQRRSINPRTVAVAAFLSQLITPSTTGIGHHDFAPAICTTRPPLVNCARGC